MPLPTPRPEEITNFTLNFPPVPTGADTPEEIEAGLPRLFAKWGHDFASNRGTEYLDGYDVTYRFGLKKDGWSTERATVRYYY